MNLKSYTSSFLEENSYLIEEPERVYLVDPGELLSSSVKEIQAKKNLFVILTHGHIDHMAGLSQLEPEGIYIHPLEKKVLFDSKFNLGFYFEADISIDKEKLINISELPEKWKIFHTPGHTPGSVCLLYENEYLFTGDTLFADSIGRTDLPGGDGKSMNRSLQILKEIIGNYPDSMILPGHGRSAEALEVLKMNPFLI